MPVCAGGVINGERRPAPSASFYAGLESPQRVLIKVHVTPYARQASVVKTGEGTFEARVDEKAEGGKANKRLVEMVSEHLGVPKSKITVVRGARSRDKVLEVAD